MKFLKIALTTLLIGVTVFILASCRSSSSTETPTSTVAIVKLGNISVDVTATGNLALSHTEDLAFAMAGTVDSISVSTGDSVTAGQELAKLDTSDQDKQIETLTKALETAQRNLTAKQRSLVQAQRTVNDKEFAVQQAQLNLQSAENSLDEISAVKEQQDIIDDINNNLQIAQSIWNGQWAGSITITNPTYWDQQILYFQKQLAQVQQELEDILDGSSINVSSDVAFQMAQSDLQVQQSQRALDAANIAVDDAKTAVDDAQLDINDAQQAVEDAQTALDDEKNLSPVITAPFDGFITKINVSGGDEIQKGTVAMQLADPNKFEAEVLVSEQDISSIKVDSDATVAVDALEVSLPAKVTYIAPTATISQGVVNYSVIVEIQSLQPVLSGTSGQSQTSQQGTLPSVSPEDLQSRLRQAVDEGRITQAQADEMLKQLQSGQTPSAGTQQPVITTQNIQLKQGLSSTITIPILQKNDVLLVPNRAISRQGKDTVVKIIKDGVIETRTVTTGVSDLSNTEVTSGLNEGEQVVISTSTTSTSTTTQGGPPGGFFRIEG